MRKFAWSFLLLPGFLAAQSGGVVELSLSRAVELALAPDGDARARLAAEAVRQAETRAAQARSALLPNLEGSVAEQNQTRNLAAFGLKVSIPLPGFQFPELVGPFSTFDARLSLGQSILDLSAIRRYQSARVVTQAASEEKEAAYDRVARLVALQYLAALRAAARLEAAEADFKLAESLLQLATNQKSAGTGTGIEVTRARVQLAQARQQLLLASNDRRQAELELLRTIGLPLTTPVRLTDALAAPAATDIDARQAADEAFRRRHDWLAQQKREESARLAWSSARFERLPTLAGFADYGSIGTSINNALPTRTYGVALRVPLFDGGRRDARRSEARSLYEQERVRSLDLRRQIELEVNLALDDLHSAAEQVKVAEEGLAQVQAELEQAQRRYQAGVTSSLEVTDAQTRLARARDNYIAALFLYNRARLDLWQATGELRSRLNATTRQP